LTTKTLNLVKGLFILLRALKKLMKLAEIVVRMSGIALAYLSYKAWLDVKWIPTENTAKNTLTDITSQAIHKLNNSASHFQAHTSTIGSANTR
jgi:hypothetical protein